MRKCFFCGETNEIVLQEHHIVPKSLNTPNRELITLCANCHRKVHYLINPLVKYANVRWETTDSLDTEEVKNQLEEIKREREAISKVLNYINQFSDKKSGVSQDKLFATLGTTINGFETKRLIGELLKKGTIYSPRTNYLKKA